MKIKINWKSFVFFLLCVADVVVVYVCVCVCLFELFDTVLSGCYGAMKENGKFASVYSTRIIATKTYAHFFLSFFRELTEYVYFL